MKRFCDAIATASLKYRIPQTAVSLLAGHTAFSGTPSPTPGTSPDVFNAFSAAQKFGGSSTELPAAISAQRSFGSFGAVVNVHPCLAPACARLGVLASTFGSSPEHPDPRMQRRSRSSGGGNHSPARSAIAIRRGGASGCSQRRRAATSGTASKARHHSIMAHAPRPSATAPLEQPEIILGVLSRIARTVHRIRRRQRRKVPEVIRHAMRTPRSSKSETAGSPGALSRYLVGSKSLCHRRSHAGRSFHKQITSVATVLAATLSRD